MRKRYFVLCVLFSFVSCLKKNNDRTIDLFSLKLISSDNLKIDFSDLKNNKATVFVFLAPDCPLSQNYTLTLNRQFGAFQKKDIAFYGIIPEISFEKKEVDDFVNKYKVKFPIVCDKDFNLAAYFKASKTPEVFVVDPNEQILYSGAIDNWASDLGIHRTVITENYLEDALNHIVKNQQVSVKKTQAIGCFIERKK